MQESGPLGSSPTPEMYWSEPMTAKFLKNFEIATREASKYDVIHVNRANPFTATILTLARGSKSALVVDMEDFDGYGGYSSYIDDRGPKGWILTSYERTFPKNASLVVVVSDLLFSYMLRVGIPRARLVKIPNGFDPQVFRREITGLSVRRKYDLGEDPVVMYASAYWKFERKLHELAFASFSRVCKALPRAKLLVVGTGNLDVAGLVREYGLTDNAILTGYVPRSMMPELMAAADVALHIISDHPFHRASSPMIISEYMAMGKAIVAPQVGELSRMLGGGTGRLVQSLNPEAVSGEVVTLLKNDKLRAETGERASAAAEGLSYEVLAKTLAASYEEALARNAR